MPTGLAHLRRFARIVEANFRAGDALVGAYLQDEQPDWLIREPTQAELASALKNLLKYTHQPVMVSNESDEVLGRAEKKALDEIDLLTQHERIAYALLYVEKFTATDLTTIVSMGIGDASKVVADTRKRAFSALRRVLIIERENEFFGALNDELDDLSLLVTRVYSVKEAIVKLGKSEFDLIIAGPSLTRETAKPLVQIAKKAEIKIVRAGATILSDDDSRSSPTSPGDVATKAKFVDQVRDLLYVDAHRWTPTDESWDDTLGFAYDIPDSALASSAAPINAEIVEGQLRLAATHSANSAVSISALDRLRLEHLRQAEELANDVRAGNAPPRLVRRLDGITELLRSALSEEMIVALGVGVDGLARLLPIIESEYLALDAADLAGFTADLQDFSNQFPIYRQFRAEASLERPLTDLEGAALRTVAAVLHAQPADVVAPALNEQFDLLLDLGARQVGSSIADVALLRSVSNALKAIGRHAKAFAVEVNGKARSLAVDGTAKLIVALPIAGVLHLLGAAFPIEFAAVVAVLTRSRKTIEKAVGDSKDDD